MKTWNWLEISAIASVILSVSSVFVGCSSEIPQVIVAEATEPPVRSYQRRPASAVPATDLVVQSSRGEDGNFYARILDKKNGVICYSVTSSGAPGAPGISCIKQ